MSTHDLKLQQTRETEERDGVARVVLNQDRFCTRTDKARSQDVSEDEESRPESAQLFHIKKDFESKTTATASSRQVTGQQKSNRDLQIKQIILLRSNKDSGKTSDDQKESSRFTAVLSIRLPTKRNKKDTTDDTEETLLKDTDIDDSRETIRRTANKHHTELRDRFSTTETCSKLFKDGDGSKAPFDEDNFSTLQSQHGLTAPNQGQDAGLHHNIDLHEQTQRAHNDLQRHSTLQSICVIQTEFSKETNANKESRTTDHRDNVLTTPQNSSEILSQVLSLAPFPTLASDPEQSHLNPASAMLASALVSVLAPPWSGRLRRPKQGGSEVEHEPQDRGQNASPPSSLRQEPRQHLSLASQRPLAERVLQEPNANDTAGTSYSSPEWQKENNSPNVATIQSKRAVMKSSSVDTYRATMYNNAELHHIPTPLDTGQVPNSPCSEERRGYRMSKTEDQNEPFKSLSSKPTTSSLLLSLRRANLRRLNEEITQTQTPITQSVRSLTLPSRSILKNAQSYASVIQNEEAGDTTVPYSFPDTPSKTDEISDTGNFHFLPRSRRVVTRPPLFLNKTDSKNPETSIARGEEHRFLNFTTKSSTHEIPKPQQQSPNLLRKYTKPRGGDAVKLDNAKSTNRQNNINNNTDSFSHISSKDKANSNTEVTKTGFNGANFKSHVSESKLVATRTFTDSLKFSPKKESFSVDEINTKNEGQTFQDTEKKTSQSSQSPMDLSSPLSPSRPTRGFRVPSIYSYLRESSPAVSTSNSPSTPFSHIQKAENSSSPMSGEIMQDDRYSVPSRFSFDIGPFDSQPLEKGSSGFLTGPAQSLPPDFGRKSAPRLSTSPYSTLISSRPALNSTLQGLSSPPSAKPLEESTSNDTITIRVYPIKLNPSPSSVYKSVTKRPKEQLGSPDREQKTNTSPAYSGAPDNHKPAQPRLLQTVPDASFVTESQSANITPHPGQQNTCSHEKHNSSMADQLNKDNSYSKHSQKENTTTVGSKTLLSTEKETSDLQMHDRLQENPNSKKSLFALRVKKDNVSTSDSMADKDDASPQYLKTKRNLPVLKTNSRIDQMLSRLKQTFGGKRSDNTVDTKTGNTATQKPSYNETFERDKRVGKRCSESQYEPSLINDKTSLKSLSPATLKKSENTLNMHVPSEAKGKKMHFGSQWTSNSSLNTDKTSLPSSKSSPLIFRKSKNTLNVESQSRFKGEKTSFGSQWASNSSLTTDKTSLPSSKSSPLTFRKSKNTLNVESQNRNKGEKTSFGSQLTSNSSLTTDKTSLPSSKSSPLTFRKSKNTLNVESINKGEKYRNKGEKTSFGSQWAQNSPLTTDHKVSLPSSESLSPLTFRKTENTLNVESQSRIKSEKTSFGSQREAPNSSLTKCENTLNVDWQSRIKGEKTYFGSQWEAPNSSSIKDKASLPSLESLSPLTFRKSQNVDVNVDGQSWIRSENPCIGSQWEASNSPLTSDKASLPSLKSMSPLTCRKRENRLNVDQQKRWSDENEKRSYSGSKHRLNFHSMNRSATLPHYRHSSLGPPSPFSLFEYDSEDIHNDSVFYSPVSKKSNSLCETDNVLQLSYAMSTVPQNLERSRLSSSCADLKYGLSNGRSFSVSSVVSSRPSGPGRISTSSVSDLSSLDDFKGNLSGFGSPINISYSPTYAAKPVTNDQSQPECTDVQNSDKHKDSSGFWDDTDPTPPPSPPLSHSSRRISQAPSCSSPIRTTPDSPSPRGRLPSRSYSTSLTVFEESGSDTTTDDEYYLDGDDDMETEL